ncbi:MAG: hypothetical protein EHM93_03840 [Bacteroidales bacterium]|nr:MAG: hypothetical protein EHM93_03840 [Bacteroidales bacterium]
MKKNDRGTDLPTLPAACLPVGRVGREHREFIRTKTHTIFLYATEKLQDYYFAVNEATLCDLSRYIGTGCASVVNSYNFFIADLW